jgi:hypothetical protein
MQSGTCPRLNFITDNTYDHLGYADVQADKPENYFKAAKMQSDDKFMAFKHA